MQYCGDDNYICVIEDSVVSNIHPTGSRIYIAAYNHNGFKSTSPVSSLLFFSMFCTNWSWRWAYPACCPLGASTATSAMTKLPYLYIGYTSSSAADWELCQQWAKCCFLVLNSMLMSKPSSHAILTVNGWVVYHLKNEGTYTQSEGQVFYKCWYLNLQLGQLLCPLCYMHISMEHFKWINIICTLHLLSY